jgi:SAM-dependent methyltransferase
MTAADPDQRSAQLTSTREFFGPRAAGWEDRFPDDDPLYAKAIAELAPAPGGVALDVACGTGRALPFLRAAVGATGTVVGVDVTAEMLATATRLGRRSSGVLVMADAVCLPFRDESHNSVFAAGLLPHVPDPPAALRELARICRSGARLALFHPIGRAALANRHGHEPDPDDVRTESRIRPLLAATGWTCELVDDAADRYLVLAVRA